MAPAVAARPGGALWPGQAGLDAGWDLMEIPRGVRLPADAARAPEPLSLTRAQVERRFARLWSVVADGHACEGDSASMPT